MLLLVGVREAGKCLNKIVNIAFNKLHRQKNWDRAYRKEDPELPAEEAQAFSQGLSRGRYVEEAISKYSKFFGELF